MYKVSSKLRQCGLVCSSYNLKYDPSSTTGNLLGGEHISLSAYKKVVKQAQRTDPAFPS
jgi:hypothetical protein